MMTANSSNQYSNQYSKQFLHNTFYAKQAQRHSLNKITIEEPLKPYADFQQLSDHVQDELLAQLALLEHFGPHLGRPYADTLKGSSYANMKELRFAAFGGVWRVAFAYDPHRAGIVLVAGNKSGSSQRRFYKQLIKVADQRFTDHLAHLIKE